MHHIFLALAITGGFIATTAAYSAPAHEAPETRLIQETAVEVDGVKFWVPSTIVVKKGDHVKIHAVSKVPGAGSVHGFAIDAFKVAIVADDKGKDVEFTADKAGIFPFRCQLHMPHVGGQLVVLE
jgi:nitrosocyanin